MKFQYLMHRVYTFVIAAGAGAAVTPKYHHAIFVGGARGQHCMGVRRHVLVAEEAVADDDDGVDVADVNPSDFGLQRKLTDFLAHIVIITTTCARKRTNQRSHTYALTHPIYQYPSLLASVRPDIVYNSLPLSQLGVTRSTATNSQLLPPMIHVSDSRKQHIVSGQRYHVSSRYPLFSLAIAHHSFVAVVPVVLHVYVLPCASCY